MLRTGLVFLIFAADLMSRAQELCKEDQPLRGPVKSASVFFVDFEWNAGDPRALPPVPWYSMTFNKDHDLTEHLSYASGELLQRLVYKHDEIGRCVGYDEYSRLDKLQGPPRRHIYAWGSDGKRAEHKVLEANGEIANWFIYRYDAYGRKLFDGDVRSANGIRYTYDRAGNELSQSYASDTRAYSWRNESKYDEKNLRLEQLRYENGKLRYKIASKYDDRGRVVEELTEEFNAIPNETRSHAPEPGRVVFIYNEKPNSKETLKYANDGSLKERLVNTFDDRGNEIEFDYFRKDSPQGNSTSWVNSKAEIIGTVSGSKRVCALQYDSHQNWTNKKCSVVSTESKKLYPVREERRLITYY